MKLQNNKTSGNPKVKDLVEFLLECNQEAYIMLSDGHEGMPQIRPSVGYASKEVLEEGGYVRDKEDFDENEEIFPAVQLDTGV